VEDALKEAVNKDMVVINLLNVLGDQVKEEELIAGMEGEEEEGEEEEPEYDEHIWLSLRNASVLTDHIAGAIAEADAANADAYMANAEAYKEKLDSLDAEYQEAVSAAEKDTLLFGDRFPFRYMTDDYGLSYFAAFPGCSAETEASFETIVFLADKVNELSLSSILTIEGSDHKIAETIRESTKSRDQQILTMNSMQSTTLEDAEGGTSYLSIMEDNLEVLKEALK
jgi:zinc transport system substrate-binding protein